MPFKLCPNQDCGEFCGVRSFHCPECGEPFPTTIKKAKGNVKIKVEGNRQSLVVNNNITVNPKGELKAAISPSFYADSCGQLNLDPGNLFDDLYGKEAAISITMSALNVYNTTGGSSRFNTLLIGSPAAGKTEVVNRIEKMVGEDNTLRFNSESASKAGMENEILNYPGDLPPLLIVEEIEKCHSDSLLWMLPTLDPLRQELIKVTSKEGMQRRKVPFICIGTSNDIDKLTKMHAGSIADRFPNKVFMRDMDDNTRRKILICKLQKLPYYNEAWIQPAIDYCREVGDMSMRKIEAVLLCGQDKLLTGEYQATLRAATR